MPIDAHGGKNLDARHDESTLGTLYLPAHISSMLLEPNQTSGHGLPSRHIQTGEKILTPVFQSHCWISWALGICLYFINSYPPYTLLGA